MLRLAARLLRVLERSAAQTAPCRDRKLSCGRATRSPASARANVASSSRLSSSTGAFTSFHVSSSEIPRPRSASRRWTAPRRSLSGWRDSTASQLSKAHSRRATRCQAASAASSCRGSCDAEVRQPGTNPRLVDYAVAPVPAGERNVRLERRLDELRIGDAPAESGEDPDAAALDEPEAPSAPGNLRKLPREEIASLLAVELRRLGEEGASRTGGSPRAASASVATQTSAAPERKRSISSRREASGIAP